MRHRKSIQLHFVQTLSRKRDVRGASIALVIAFAGVLLVCLIAAFQLSNLFGASEEARNGVDAGALAVAVRSVDVKTGPQSIYGDCVDNSGSIGLTNINRVFGKSLLVNANVQSMVNEQQAGNTAMTNAEQATSGAQAINDELFLGLTNKSNESSLFNTVATLRGAKLLTGSAAVVPSAQDPWPTAALLRGRSSNLIMNQNQIPPDANVRIPTVATGAGTFAPGYTPVTVNDKKFYFVAFNPNEKPHLVSNSLFDANRIDKVPIAGISNPIPNAFSAVGNVQGNQGGLAADAFALANPQRQYVMSIPHAYISIQITNTAQWFVAGKQIAETQYTTEPETQWGVKNYVLPNKAILQGYASLGNEYVTKVNGQIQPKTLWGVVTSLPGNYNLVLAQMTQRLQEVQPNFSQGALTSLLMKQQIAPNVTRYLIYPAYTTHDATNPTISIAALTGALPGWLNPVYVADGIEKTLVTQPPEQDMPNFDWQMIAGQSVGYTGHHTMLLSNLNWEPDSGFNQCLGQLRIAHTTQCFFAENP
jgi:Flp pilus assembly protein TadG